MPKAFKALIASVVLALVLLLPSVDSYAVPGVIPASPEQISAMQGSLKNMAPPSVQKTFPGLQVFVSLNPASPSDLAQAVEAARPGVEAVVRDRADQVTSAVARGRMSPQELAQAASELGRFGFFGGKVVDDSIRRVAGLAGAARDETMGQATAMAEALLAESGKLTLDGMWRDSWETQDVVALRKKIQAQPYSYFTYFEHPNPSIRKAVLKRALQIRLKEIDPDHLERQRDPFGAIRDYLKSRQDSLKSGSDARLPAFDLLREGTQEVEWSKTNKIISSIAVTVLGLCPSNTAKALRLLVQRLMPASVWGYKLGYVSLVDSYFSDARVLKTVLQASQDALEKIQGFERGIEMAASDVLSDLRAAARKALGEDDEKLVWKILGFYGVKGPDLSGWRAAPETNRTALLVATQVLFGSLTYLDSLHFARFRKSYSLPASIASPAALPKPYHFWLPAFLVKELAVADGIPPDAASRAVHWAHVGYEFAAETEGRRPWEALSDGSFSIYNNNIRGDLVVAAGGNYFGSSLAKGKAAAAIQPLDLGELWRDYYAELKNEPALKASWAKFLTETDLHVVHSGGQMALKASWAQIVTKPILKLCAYFKWRRIIQADLPRRIIARRPS